MIFTGERNCEKCSHRRVCKIKNDIIACKDAVDKLKERTHSIDITITCKEFREDVAVRTPFRN